MKPKKPTRIFLDNSPSSSSPIMSDVLVLLLRTLWNQGPWDARIQIDFHAFHYEKITPPLESSISLLLHIVRQRCLINMRLGILQKKNHLHNFQIETAAFHVWNWWWWLITHSYISWGKAWKRSGWGVRRATSTIAQFSRREDAWNLNPPLKMVVPFFSIWTWLIPNTFLLPYFPFANSVRTQELFTYIFYENI